MAIDKNGSPGFRLYYTAKRRQHDLGILVLGQEYVTIPPYQKAVIINGVCSRACTSAMITDRITVLEAAAYMHSLGM